MGLPVYRVTGLWGKGLWNYRVLLVWFLIYSLSQNVSMFNCVNTVFMLLGYGVTRLLGLHISFLIYNLGKNLSFR